MSGSNSNSLRTIYTFTQTVKGQIYKFRYRTKNEIGWSGFSSETSVLAADVPSKLATPKLDAYSSTSITLNFNLTCDNGGSSITAYVLEMNTGTPGSAFSTVGSYTSGSLTHTLTDTTDGLVDGKVYTFRIYASNSVGNSEYSDELSVAVTDVLAASTISKSMSQSSSNSIYVTWSAVTPGVSPGGDITGYILTVKDCNNGTEWVAFNGIDLSLPT